MSEAPYRPKYGLLPHVTSSWGIIPLVDTNGGEMTGAPTATGTTVAQVTGPHRPLREPGLPLWLRRVLPGGVIAFIVVKTLAPLGDPDTLWHIRAGDLLLSNGQFTQHDPWSAVATRPWVLHQWLPEVVMALLNRAFGLPGVAWGFTLAVALLGLTLWWVLRQRAGLLVTALISIITIVGMSASLSPRPQIVSFILAPIVVHAWLETARDGRARWWLIPLSWLWACCHGLWVVGPAVGLVAVAGMALDRLARTDPPDPAPQAESDGMPLTPARSWRSLGRLALVPLGSVLVALVTPVGPALFASFGEVRQVAPYLDEWQPTTPTQPGFIAVVVLVAIPVLVVLRTRQRMSWVTILLLVVSVGAALIYGRTIPIGAAIAAPISAAALQRLIRMRRERVDRTESVVTILITVLALAITGVMAPSAAAEPAGVPTSLTPALNALPDGTVVCNQDAVGGWLIWAHPELRPTLDTRMEIYGGDTVRAYASFLGANPGWQGYLNRTHCTAALLEAKTPVVEALTAQLHWRQVAKGEDYVLLTAPTDGSTT